ncbi:sigma-70 family RNA polymerase sigma factor [Corallococcus sp. CA053C]|uniref:RNA polymerase sigma factor n=1 Tax=Corallococcus sp. CA053C TaxID=2316732 RepID=UPI000EA11916|nr:sigma-70 family RNA polymerase sigma factor [Corallococcus sp. CA053C]RKG98363.1 sigma-70 family RNA polymerase sigma factor [Corallococcus sp. CA053C]
MSLSPEALGALLRHHHAFLAFLTPRVGSQEAAREVLQAAFVKGLEEGGSLREEQSAVAWFYRLLRNALVDAHRRARREDSARESLARELPLSTEDATALETKVCGCVAGLADTLKPEYAQAVRRVDLEGVGVASFAQEAGISPNNAAVRLHRARQALGRRLVELCGHCCAEGCVDCACASP